MVYVLLTTHRKSIVSRIIRFFEALRWRKAKYSHAALGNGHILIEAIPSGVVQSNPSKYRSRGHHSVICVPKFLTEDQASKVWHHASSYLGRRYGYFDLAAYALDALFRTTWFTRTLNCPERLVCSELVARAFEVVGYRFGGLAPASVSPEGIWRAIQSEPDRWEVIVYG